MTTLIDYTPHGFGLTAALYLKSLVPSFMNLSLHQSLNFYNSYKRNLDLQ